MDSTLPPDPRSFSKSVLSSDEVMVTRSWDVFAVLTCLRVCMPCKFCWLDCEDCWDWRSSVVLEEIDSVQPGSGWGLACVCCCNICFSGGATLRTFAPPPDVSSSDVLYWRLITAAVPAALSTQTSSLKSKIQIKALKPNNCFKKF